jgi:curved DNA-binding protein CbpA
MMIILPNYFAFFLFPLFPLSLDRRLAIQYHPDKWRQDSDHGMTKEDAEEEFKRIQSAYDHLMSNFDEDE